MKTVLILHGIGSDARGNWFPWLKKELERRDYKVILPNLPNPKKPDRKKWLEHVQRLIKDVNFNQLVIIGHSLGVATALDLVEKEDRKLKMLISVSGFFEDYGSELNSYFMKERKFNMDKVANLVENKVVILGDNDPYVPQDTLRNFAKRLGVEPVVVKNGGHINSESGYTELPLLFYYLN